MKDRLLRSLNNYAGTGKKWVSFLLFALAIGASTFAVFWWSQSWNYPKAKSLGNKGHIYYGNIPIDVEIDCVCPEVLTENVERSLTFDIHLMPPQDAASPGDYGETILEMSAGNASVDPPKMTFTYGQLLFSTAETSKSVTVKVQPKDTTVSAIVFQFSAVHGQMPLGSVGWPIQSHPSARSILTPFLYSGGVFTLALGILLWADRQSRRLKERYERERNEARIRAEQNPKDARYAWDLARVTLEQYFGRNLIQVNLVFWVAVFVMSIGFILIMVGVLLSLRQPQITPASLVSAVSGLIAQFIGATFMVIYRSTMTQASEFVTVLDRINRVGMAVQVLDAIDEGELKNQTRATIATSLLGRAPETDSVQSQAKKVGAS